mgnify:CR=1 FL=1
MRERPDRRRVQCAACRFSPACAGETSSPLRATPRKTVQPRVCGRDFQCDACLQTIDGSAPRVRERPGVMPSITGRERFSPACAGETRSSRPTLPRSSVQPRVCGRDRSVGAVPRRGGGSAPRVRERRLRPAVAVNQPRFSPACAGETEARANGEPAGTVQPRVCGRDRFLTATVRGGRGSAPRVRERLSSCSFRRCCGRFSPACAGETLAPARLAMPPAVQPRVCGRDKAGAANFGTTCGSAPRVRERHPGRPKGSRNKRFSPACAGETLASRTRPTPSSVQPRVCGRDDQFGRSSNGGAGSAPRVRERPGGCFASWSPTRFSPACAGETIRSFGAPQMQPVQPRVCGRDTLAATMPDIASGSAPRVRERLAVAQTNGYNLRFSPACAGETSAVGWRSSRSAVQPHVCGRDTGTSPASPAASGSAPRVRERRA